jgi:Na+/H+ antiporter NhaC
MDLSAVDVGFWSVFPPLFAIVLALVTKEVIFSLVLGIASGVLIFGLNSGFGFTEYIAATIQVMGERISANALMVLFLALLGALVALITRSGGARAYGLWAAKKLSTKRSVSLTTALLGMIIFIDDYFNCLTVGTVMKPVTDQHKMSREKLAYIIDSTAAPICIIAPISSWAASVASYLPAEAGINGIEAFVRAIPFNLYPLLTLFMIIWMSIRKNGDYGPMAKAERDALHAGEVKNAEGAVKDDIAALEVSERGLVLDLISPVIILVAVCIAAMLYYGGFGSIGEDGVKVGVAAAFADTDASAALAMGGFITLVIAFFLYVPRKLISFKDYFASFTAGVKAMVPALIILTLAWTIAGVCRNMLNTGSYLAGVVNASDMPVGLIPAIMFIVACCISFSTGTAWGTFGILIPITITVCHQVAPELTIPTLASVMGGSVFGDHCSPISDTTILSSTGSGCDHLAHVATQVPYAVTVASVSFIGYLIIGFTAKLGTIASIALSLPISLALLIMLLIVLPKLFKAK